jgi:hypothetical protein
MNIGQENKSKQVLVRKTKMKSTTHWFARIWAMRCNICSRERGSDACDAHERHCAACDPAAKPGEPL